MNKDKPKDKQDEDLKRSECSLMYVLIRRNPERARIFLARLAASMR
jgi:hypothetical protein